MGAYRKLQASLLAATSCWRRVRVLRPFRCRCMMQSEKQVWQTSEHDGGHRHGVGSFGSELHPDADTLQGPTAC